MGHRLTRLHAHLDSVRLRLVVHAEDVPADKQRLPRRHLLLACGRGE